MNPDGEQDYQGHLSGHYPRVARKDRGSDWPMALFLIVLVLAVTAICITGLITLG